MAIEDYHMEQDRRLNTAITEVAIIKEQVKNTRDSLEELKSGQHDAVKVQQQLLEAVAKGNASNDRLEATLKYSINDQIQTALIPIKTDIANLREESVIRKTQLGMIVLFGTGAGSIIALIGSTLWNLFMAAPK